MPDTTSSKDLSRLMTVVNSSDWIALLAIVLLLMLAAVWGVSGNLTTTVTGHGAFVESGSELAGVFYVPAADGRVIRPGMPARITPDSVASGYSNGLEARVTAVSAIDGSGLNVEQLRGADEIRKFIRTESWVKVTARLSSGAPTPVRTPHTELAAGIKATARITVEQQAPIAYLFPGPTHESTLY